MTRTTYDGEHPAERRLRQALDTRAAGITVRELRPADPPGPGLRWSPVARLRGFTLPLAGLAVAAAALVGYLVLAPDAAPLRPSPPAAPPELTPSTPTPGPAPSVHPSPTGGTAESAEPTAAPGSNTGPSYPVPRATPSVSPTTPVGNRTPSASPVRPPGAPSPSRPPSSPSLSPTARPESSPSSSGQG